MLSFVKLGEALEQGRGSNPRKLLRLITHGLVTDTIRQAARRPEPFPLTEVSEEQLGAETFLTTDRATFRDRFDVAVRGLPAEERDAFILTELRGLTQREASAVLGTSPATVNALDQQARAAVRKELT